MILVICGRGVPAGRASLCSGSKLLRQKQRRYTCFTDGLRHRARRVCGGVCVQAAVLQTTVPTRHPPWAGCRYPLMEKSAQHNKTRCSTVLGREGCTSFQCESDGVTKSCYWRCRRRILCLLHCLMPFQLCSMCPVEPELERAQENRAPESSPAFSHGWCDGVLSQIAKNPPTLYTKCS